MDQPRVDPESIHFRDELTSLPNRRFLHRHIEFGIAWDNRTSPVSVVLFDFDGFRRVNEEADETTGDAVLLRIAELGRPLAGPNGVLGRYGGDSFMVVLPGTTKDDALKVVDQFRALALAKINPPLTMSAGVATFPDDAVRPAMMLDCVQKALYVAKQSGRDQVVAAGRLDEKIAAGRELHSTIPCPVFVNRDDELRIAMVLLDQLRRARPGFLWIQGTPGIGKSRLLQEVRKRVHAVKVACFGATCSESKRDVPGDPLIKIIDRYYELNPASILALRPRFNSLQQAVLGGLVPAFASWKAMGQAHSATDRVSLVAETIRETLCAMAAEHPLLVQIDNADHVDQLTIEILAAATGERKAPIGIMMAGEGDAQSLDPDRAIALQNLIKGLPSTLNPKAAALGPLARKGLGAMLAAHLPGAVLPDGFADQIFDASGGNPQYVEEAVRGLLLSRKIQRTGKEWRIAPLSQEDLPPALDDLVRRVTGLLPKDAYDILAHASILDWPFELQVLQEILGQHKPRILDAIDRLRLVGLVRPVLETAREEFEFTAGHTRTVVARTFENESRRRAHRRIANILRLRSLDQPGANAATIEYHVGLAGDPPGLIPAGKAADNYESQQILAALSKGSTHLTPVGVNRTIEFLRLFNGLLTMRRLFPQWPQAGENFRTALGSTCGILFDEVPTLVFGITAGELIVNDIPIESGRIGRLGRHVIRALDSRFIATISFHRGLELKEVDALLAGLAKPLEASGVRASHWENFLRSEGVEHIEINQAGSRKQDHETVRLRRAQTTQEKPLTADEMGLFWEALGALVSAADNLRQFGPGTPIVEQNLDLAASAFEKVLSKEAMISMTAAVDELLVNGCAAAPVEDRDQASAAFIVSQMDAKNLQRVTLMHGLDGDEIRMIASFLSIEVPSRAMVVLEANEAPHIVLAFRDEHAALSALPMAMPETQEGAFFDDFEPIPLTPIEPAAAKPMMVRIDMRARTMILSPIDVFLSERIAKEFTPTIEILYFGHLNAQAFELIDRLCSFLVDADPEWRKRALLLVNRAMTEANDSRDLIFERIRLPLLACLKTEQDAGVQKVLAESIRLWATMAMKADRLPVLAEFLKEGVKARVDSQNTSRDFKTALLLKLQTLASVSPNPAIESLKTGSEAGAQIVSLMGPPAILPLISMIRSTESLDIRLAAARALRAIGGTGQADLAGKVRPDVHVDQCRRVLEVLDEAGTGSVSTAIFLALDHADPIVHQAAFKLLRRIDRAVAIVVLRKLVVAKDQIMTLSAFAAARDMQIPELCVEAGKMASEGEDEGMVRAACDYLGSFPSPASLPALRRVFDQKPKAFGLVKGFSDQTRAAAILAAKKINHPEARQLVKDAAEDKSELVRRVCQSKGPTA